MELVFIDVPAFPCFDESVLCFRDRCSGDLQELMEFAMVVPPETFSNVSGSRPEAPTHVVAKTAIPSRTIAVKNCRHLRAEFVGKLPTLEFCEVSYAHTKDERSNHAC